METEAAAGSVVVVAAPHGGEAMAAIIDVWLLDRAGRELLDGLEEGGEG